MGTLAVDRYAQWIAVNGRKYGPDANGYDNMDMMRSATDFAWMVYDEAGFQERTLYAEAGIRYIAAAMVVSAKYDPVHILALENNGPATARHIQRIASATDGMVHEILMEAATINLEILLHHLTTAGAYSSGSAANQSSIPSSSVPRSSFEHTRRFQSHRR